MVFTAAFEVAMPWAMYVLAPGFDAVAGRRFSAQVTEVGVASTGVATTYPVTVRLVDRVDDVRPGMAAEVAIAFGDEHGYPVAVKAMFGGGGRGMRIVKDANELASSYERAKSEAKAAFGSDEMYVEKFVDKPMRVWIDHHILPMHPFRYP